MKSNSIETWLQDGLIICSRYQDKITKDCIASAKSLGERSSEKDCRFYSLLFTIVIAIGVLVSRVQNYQKFVEYFIRKMVRCSSGYILFNMIGEIDFSSPNYSNYKQVGRSTFFPRKALESILDKIDGINYRIVEERNFSRCDRYVCSCFYRLTVHPLSISRSNYSLIK
jgi:hypothetical protein